MRNAHLIQNIVTCLILIAISLCCRSALYNKYTFVTPELIQTNTINKLFLENLIKMKKMDLEM